MAHNSWLAHNSVVGDRRGHIRTWLIFLFFAMLPCRGGDGGLSIRAVLYTSFQTEPPPAIMEYMRDELAAIMSPMGFHIEWRSLSEGTRYPEAVKLAVITFKGRCDDSGDLPKFRTGGVLGLTHVINGEVVPFSDIDCDAIRAFLQKELWMRYSDARPQVFGRGIARVLAHELYHIFARTAKHAPCGLGKSPYTTTDLVSNEFQFEKGDAIALRNGSIMENRENGRKIPKARRPSWSDAN
jgi:hypothetical protein